MNKAQYQARKIALPSAFVVAWPHFAAVLAEIRRMKGDAHEEVLLQLDGKRLRIAYGDPFKGLRAWIPATLHGADPGAVGIDAGRLPVVPPKSASVLRIIVDPTGAGSVALHLPSRAASHGLVLPDVGSKAASPDPFDAWPNNAKWTRVNLGEGIVAERFTGRQNGASAPEQQPSKAPKPETPRKAPKAEKAPKAPKAETAHKARKSKPQAEAAPNLLPDAGASADEWRKYRPPGTEGMSEANPIIIQKRVRAMQRADEQARKQRDEEREAKSAAARQEPKRAIGATPPEMWERELAAKNQAGARNVAVQDNSPPEPDSASDQAILEALLAGIKESAASVVANAA